MVRPRNTKQKGESFENSFGCSDALSKSSHILELKSPLVPGLGYVGRIVPSPYMRGTSTEGQRVNEGGGGGHVGGARKHEGRPCNGFLSKCSMLLTRS